MMSGTPEETTAPAIPHTAEVRRSPWMTTDEACAYLRFEGEHRLRSLYRFLHAKGVPTVRRSERRILIAVADLDAALAGRSAVRRRNARQVAR